MKIKKIISIIFLLIIVNSISIAYAYEVGAPGQDTRQNARNNLFNFSQTAGLNVDSPGLQSDIIRYINILLSFIGLIFLVLIIISGIQWMTSGGNESIIDKARGNIKSSIMGLLIVLGAWVIANGIMAIIVRGEGANIESSGGIYDDNPSWQ